MSHTEARFHVFTKMPFPSHLDWMSQSLFMDILIRQHILLSEIKEGEPPADEPEDTPYTPYGVFTVRFTPRSSHVDQEDLMDWLQQATGQPFLKDINDLNPIATCIRRYATFLGDKACDTATVERLVGYMSGFDNVNVEIPLHLVLGVFASLDTSLYFSHLTVMDYYDAECNCGNDTVVLGPLYYSAFMANFTPAMADQIYAKYEGKDPKKLAVVLAEIVGDLSKGVDKDFLDQAIALLPAEIEVLRSELDELSHRHRESNPELN